jgi:hypothetical protein
MTMGSNFYTEKCPGGGSNFYVENPHRKMIREVDTYNPNKVFFTQALGGLESFITRIGNRFPKFYNASLYPTFLKCTF